jgi:hypothetical protein
MSRLSEARFRRPPDDDGKWSVLTFDLWKVVMIDRMSILAAPRTWIRIFCLTASLPPLAGVSAKSQSTDEMPAIGQINYFGYGGIDLQPIEAAMPIKLGGVLSLNGLKSTQDLIEQRIRGITGHVPTNIDFVCCDEHRHLLIFIGLGGTSSRTPPFRPDPNGSDHLEPAALKLYQQNMDALMAAVQRGSATEDDSNGYALNSDAELHRIQLHIRAYALDRGPELERVLRDAADPKQRQVSAALLGYAKRSPSQIQGLADAILDSDSEVRNNAVRALMVLTSVKSTTPIHLNLTSIEALLSSGVWSDRNKASLLLDNLTASRDPAMLHELRATSLDALIEGASWHGDPGHAGAFVILLGRIANLSEEQLLPTPDAVSIARIIERARVAD